MAGNIQNITEQSKICMVLTARENVDCTETALEPESLMPELVFPRLMQA